MNASPGWVLFMAAVIALAGLAVAALALTALVLFLAIMLVAGLLWIARYVALARHAARLAAREQAQLAPPAAGDVDALTAQVADLTQRLEDLLDQRDGHHAGPVIEHAEEPSTQGRSS